MCALAAVRRETNKGWREWFAILDACACYASEKSFQRVGCQVAAISQRYRRRTP
jgi:hypothetical protein